MRLEDLYTAYQSEVADTLFYCKKGCATCCTRSVNMTTAEGTRVLKYMEENSIYLPDLHLLKDLPAPSRTTNQAATFYLEEMIPPDSVDEHWNFLPCLFLENDVCAIYPVRPFCCRSFGSLAECRKMHSAEAPEWFITLNLFIMQLVEQLDRYGYWGNMFEILGYLSGERNTDNLLKTESIPGFLIPEEDRIRVISYLARLREIVGRDLELQKIYEILGRSIKE